MNRRLGQGSTPKPIIGLWSPVVPFPFYPTWKISVLGQFWRRRLCDYTLQIFAVKPLDTRCNASQSLRSEID